MIAPEFVVYANLTARDIVNRLTERIHHLTENDDDAELPDPKTLQAIVAAHSDPKKPSASLGGIALYEPAVVFSKLHERVAVVFKIRMAIALFIFVLLVVTIVLAIIGLVIGNKSLAAGLGATALVDLITAGVYKPLDRIAETLRDTQRLDLIHTMTEEQLQACQHHSPDKRFEAQQQVWTDTFARLEALEGRQVARRA